MIDERAVVRVWHGKPSEGGEHRGTAFLISPECLLTACHVIENRPVAEIYLQGQAWGGIRSLQKAVCHENPDIDMAILYLPKKEDRSIFLPVAPEKDADLKTGSTVVTLLGYGTADCDLEKIPGTISSYDGDCDLDVIPTSIAKGMSGGPVISNGRVVGLIRARHHDENKTYLVRLNSCRDFLLQSGCLLDRPLAKGLDVIIAQDEFVGRIREKIQEELRRRPLKPLAEILQKRVDVVAGPKKQVDAASWLCQGDIVASLTLLRHATRECLQKLADNSMGEDTLRKMCDGAVNILGWLVLLVVDPEWVRQHGSSLITGNTDVRFEVPCRTDAGLETLVARVGAEAPALYKCNPGGTEISGQHGISGSTVVGDWNEDNCVREILKRIYKEIYHATPPHPFTDLDKDRLNATLQTRLRDGEIHYLSIPVTEKDNPLHNEAVRATLRKEFLREESYTLQIVYFGIGNGDGVLLLSDVDLEANIQAFLQLIKEYQ